MFECGVRVCFNDLLLLLRAILLCGLKPVLPHPSRPHHQAPSSLLEALEQHLASLEGKKMKDASTVSRYLNSSWDSLYGSMTNMSG